MSVLNLVVPEILEAMACNEALSLAMDLACNNVIVSTDCIATVNHLKEEYMGKSAVIMHSRT
jgi:hypothetical protein